MSRLEKRLDVKEFDEWIGGRVRDLRERYEWSQATLAEKLRVEQNTVSRYETGEFSLTAYQLAQLSSVFAITLDSWLVSDETWQKFLPQL